MSKQEKETLRCPICSKQETHVGDFSRHFNIHTKAELAAKLAFNILAQDSDSIPKSKYSKDVAAVVKNMRDIAIEHTIPVAKVLAKIKELDTLLPEISDGKILKPEEWDYIDQARLLTIQYLKDFLPKPKDKGEKQE